MTDRPGTAGGAWLRIIGPQTDGATPLGVEDVEGLIPAFVATRADLDQVEFESIGRAYPWAIRRARVLGPLGLLDRAFLFDLHRRMFRDVWRWAGKQRTRDTNLGSPPHLITTDLRQALDDASFWHETEVFPVDERAVRLHHRLVRVHPFGKGNGRCTRLVADLYLDSLGLPMFSWGRDLSDPAAAREGYIQALRQADERDYAALLAFARS